MKQRCMVHPVLLVRQTVEGSGFTVAVRVDDTLAHPFSLKAYQLEFTPGEENDIQQDSQRMWMATLLTLPIVMTNLTRY